MNLDPLNYNPVGRLGPLYPKPEYRPAENPPAGEEAPEKTDKNPVRVKLENRAQSQAQARQAAARPDLGGRLTLTQAQDLTQTVSEAVSRLTPEATNSGPHRLNPYWGLINRRYV
ncbi:MAG: hypothetical protein LBK52_07540 [Deltaproteobacteria bacterium]|jgi:hypothetical protein|nr:hypothetical protein [Deltaproteobacteria bacterium]